MLHVCYFLAGFVTFGVAWFVWWLHALLFYVVVTRRDPTRLRGFLDDLVEAVRSPATQAGASRES